MVQWRKKFSDFPYFHGLKILGIWEISRPIFTIFPSRGNMEKSRLIFPIFPIYPKAGNIGKMGNIKTHIPPIYTIFPSLWNIGNMEIRTHISHISHFLQALAIWEISEISRLIFPVFRIFPNLVSMGNITTHISIAWKYGKYQDLYSHTSHISKPRKYRKHVTYQDSYSL